MNVWNLVCISHFDLDLGLDLGVVVGYLNYLFKHLKVMLANRCFVLQTLSIYLSKKIMFGKINLSFNMLNNSHRYYQQKLW